MPRVIASPGSSTLPALIAGGGIGALACGRAVCTHEMVMHDALDERLVRNELWKNRPPQRFYDAMEWLYGWTVKNCLAQD
ncbi:hypothetical protein GCM10010975_25200 [Comamonas phosphati]|nr:hypothetical protein GCM10010975_25200 [Comamonas phosphati]